MALGNPIGYSARLTQNNHRDGLYQNQMNNGAAQIHIALMGDPSLRMHVVAPPTRLVAGRHDREVTLDWLASDDSLIGYHVYRARTPKGPFTRLTHAAIKGTSFIDPDPMLAVTYMVRGLKLESSGSGTYYNLSQGTFVTPVETVPIPALASRDTANDLIRAARLDVSVSSNTNAPSGDTSSAGTTGQIETR